MDEIVLREALEAIQAETDLCNQSIYQNNVLVELG